MPPLQGQEILEELLAGFGENGFGVELDAFDFVAAVAEGHVDAVIGLGGDDEFKRQGFFLDDQGMVARGGEGIRQLAENIFAVVMDLARFAVEELRGADDFAAERSANGLMAEAHTEDRKFSGEALDQLHGNARLLRRARTRRNYDAFRISPDNLFHGDFVVAVHLDVATQLAEILREVVGKGIVVVEKQNHFGFLDRFPQCAFSSAASSAFDLFTLSCYSPPGVESATMPPPACTWAMPFLITIVRSAMQESRLPAKSR